MTGTKKPAAPPTPSFVFLLVSHDAFALSPRRRRYLAAQGDVLHTPLIHFFDAVA